MVIMLKCMTKSINSTEKDKILFALCIAEIKFNINVNFLLCNLFFKFEWLWFSFLDC